VFFRLPPYVGPLMMAFAYNAFFLCSMWLVQRRHFGGEGNALHTKPRPFGYFNVFGYSSYQRAGLDFLPSVEAMVASFIKLPKSGFMVEVKRMHFMLFSI
jgi:hypothetical protein